MTKVYTKKGDKGTTSLFGNKKVSKSNIRIESYGSVDELIAFIGLLKNYLKEKSIKEFLLLTQNNLITIASILSMDYSENKSKIIIFNNEEIKKLELEIDKIETLLPKLTEFVIPGENKLSSHCHICRTVCRRAERNIVKLSEEENVNNDILAYINRLSDYFFVLSRLLE